MLSISLLTISSNSSYMAFRISQIVAFVSPDLSDCLVFTHCVSPAPRLESFGVVVPAPVVPVAMVPWLLFAADFFNSSSRWFHFVILPILLTSPLVFVILLFFIAPIVILHRI